MHRALIAFLLISTAALAEEPAPASATPATPATPVAASAPTKSALKTLLEEKSDADEEYETAVKESWWTRILSSVGGGLIGAGGAFTVAYYLIPDTAPNQPTKNLSLIGGSSLLACGSVSAIIGYFAEASSYHVEEKRVAALRAQERVNEEAQKY